MKTIISLAVVWFLTIIPSVAQKPITIKETSLQFQHGSIPGILVAIPEVPLKTIEDSWVKTLEKGTKSKVQAEMGEMSIFGAINKDIAGGPMNIYSYVRQKDTVVLLAASFELKKDEYITSENRDFEFGKAKTFMFQFAKDHYLSLAKDELQTEEKKLNKLESSLNSLQNDKSKLEKMIQSNNSSITTLNEELVVSRASLQSLSGELSTQKTQMEGMDEGAGKEEKQKYITDLEKRIKKTENEISSGEKKVTAMAAEIENAQKDGIPKNMKEQEQLKIEIAEQKEVVKFYTSKYNTIKAYGI
ncbi:MAG: hypothetical protein JXB00_13385 [Bacteroidales bacterium]|nr:hypothetical protein [Bacteroidales bacterium]